MERKTDAIIELKSRKCPVCGGPVCFSSITQNYTWVIDRYAVCCKGCDATTKRFKTVSEAIKAFNRGEMK